MHTRFRHLIACFLMALLPLQAAASLAVYACAASIQPGQMAMMQHMTMAQDHDCCEGQAAQQDHGTGVSPCGMSTGCAAMGGAPALPVTHRFSLDAAGLDPAGYTPAHYISHIPEGLQRPPALPA